MTEDIDVDAFSLVCSESEDEFEFCSDCEKDMILKILCNYEIDWIRIVSMKDCSKKNCCKDKIWEVKNCICFWQCTVSTVDVSVSDVSDYVHVKMSDKKKIFFFDSASSTHCFQYFHFMSSSWTRLMIFFISSKCQFSIKTSILCSCFSESIETLTFCLSIYGVWITPWSSVVVRMTFCLVSRFLTINTQESRYGAQRLKKQSMYSVKYCTVISCRQEESDSDVTTIPRKGSGTISMWGMHSTR